MISDEELDRFRIEGIKVRVIRDGDEANDVKGQIMAWGDEHVLVRKQNRKLLKLDRNYTFQPWEQERKPGLPD